MKAAVLVLITSCMLTACSRNEPPPPQVNPSPPIVETPAPDPAPPTQPAATPAPTPETPAAGAATATATLAGKSGKTVKGDLRFTAVSGGVRVDGSVLGLTPGDHGFHVHEKGDCSAPDASSAGAHLNPHHTEHGGGPTSTTRHLGDIPNIKADEAGVAKVETLVQGAKLRDGSVNDIVGKAIVVHARPDNYISQPAGDAGDRVACAIIR